MAFIGRKKELELVKEILTSNKPELLVLYGRRRLGKSTLLKKSIENNKNALYFQFFEEPSLKNLFYFKKALADFYSNSVFDSIQADSWFDYFNKISTILPEKFILIFDEFSYLIGQDSSVPSHFQRIYDEIVKPKKGKLILCGSSSSVMSDLLEYKAPLYGRRTASIHLEEFSLKETSQFLNKIKNKKELLKYYATFGGIPYYLEQIRQDISYEENLKRLFFEQKSFFHDEVKFLLKEEVREIRNYFVILQSIGSGKTKLNEIVDVSGVEKSSASKYLFTLEQIGIIKQIKSFFDKKNSKNRRYLINDFFLSFWFEIFSTEMRNLSNPKIQEEIMKNKIPCYFGHAFERICMFSIRDQYEEVGTYFRGVEIDILAKNKEIIDVFECKFTENVQKNELEKLKLKIQYLPEGYTYSEKLLFLHKDTFDLLF